MVYFKFLLLILINSCDCFEFNFGNLKDLTYCSLPFIECCSAGSIPADINTLERDLTNNLFGQHILIEQLIPALKAHFEESTKSKKPLVISFHGTPGTGKNYVSDFIAKNLYKKGFSSKFVHKFGRADFPLESKVDDYKLFISSKITEEISKCPRSLFIFDEIDKIPRGVFESLTTFLEYHDNIKGVEYSKAVFLFLSNTAGKEIAERLHEFLKMGAQRSETKLHDFEGILEAGAYMLSGGLQGGGLLEAHLIDHFLPFLPLEKQHVRQCIIAEYNRRNVEPNENSVNEILNNYVTYHKLFSVSGCKRLDAKVKTDIMVNYRTML